MRNPLQQLLMRFKIPQRRRSAETIELDPFLDAAASIVTADTHTNVSRSKVSLIKECASDGVGTSRETAWSRSMARFSGWRGGVLLNTVIIATILVLNLIFLLWTIVRRKQGQSTLFRGSCRLTSRWMLVAHGVINTLGSIALGASNYAMQVLVAPTRQEVDRAHKEERFMFIGIQSPTNLRFMPRSKLVLWYILAASSIPFHLIYNSVLYSTTGANEFYSVIATPGLLSGAPYDRYTYRNATPFLESLKTFKSNSSVQNLSRTDCATAYDADIQSTYRNVLVVTNDSDATSNSTIFASGFSSPFDASARTWSCLNNTQCVLGEIVRNMSLWNNTFFEARQTKLGKNIAVSYCMAEKVEESGCSIEVSLVLMIFVLLANVAKLASLLWLLRKHNSPTLVTIGDTVASFLEHQDPYTRHHALATIDFDGFAKENTTARRRLTKVKSRRRPWLENPKEQLYRPRNWPGAWFYSVSATEWFLGFVCYGVMLAFATSTLMINVQYLKAQGIGTSLTSLASLGFGRARTDSVLASSSNVSALILIANIPQLVLSFGYLLFNRLITKMVGSREWSLFAYQRKGLRVTSPHKDQRSTYWLQLPMKFCLPLLFISIALHYVVSQSFFLISMDVRQPYGQELSQKYRTVGYSAIAHFSIIIIILFLATTACILGCVRNKPGIPPSRSCSAIISAACHPPSWEENPHEKKVQWGAVMPCSQFRDGQWPEASEPHCSFSSGDVEFPEEGRPYY